MAYRIETPRQWLASGGSHIQIRERWKTDLDRETIMHGAYIYIYMCVMAQSYYEHTYLLPSSFDHCEQLFLNDVFICPSELRV